jgi:hypothetical protein
MTQKYLKMASPDIKKAYKCMLFLCLEMSFLGVIFVMGVIFDTPEK